MSRNYSLPTIKTLFGESSECAYPGCGEPLIFVDRGRKTAIAEIAHVRSEAPGGPRYDANYCDDVDGPDNLLLLCGKHHKAVDRHESIYTVAELEAWKVAQQAGAEATGGTPVSESDLRSYVTLTRDDVAALSQISRLTQRVITSVKRARYEIVELGLIHEAARKRAWAQLVAREMMLEGENEHLDFDTFKLPLKERADQCEERKAVWRPNHDKIMQTIDDLEEEVAALRMKFGRGAVSSSATAIVDALSALRADDPEGAGARLEEVDGLVARLWRVANGEVDPTDAQTIQKPNSFPL